MEFSSWKGYGYSRETNLIDLNDTTYFGAFKLNRPTLETETILISNFKAVLYVENDKEFQIIKHPATKDKEEFQNWSKEVFNYLINLDIYL
jgi:hypothetical protein